MFYFWQDKRFGIEIRGACSREFLARKFQHFLIIKYNHVHADEKSKYQTGIQIKKTPLSSVENIACQMITSYQEYISNFRTMLALSLWLGGETLYFQTFDPELFPLHLFFHLKWRFWNYLCVKSPFIHLLLKDCLRPRVCRQISLLKVVSCNILVVHLWTPSSILKDHLIS